MRDLKQICAPGLDDFLRGHLRLRNLTGVTEIQRKALLSGVADGKSLVVCAPTSSGKTLVGEIAIVQGIRNGNRCLYLVSHKALAEQKYVDFLERIDLTEAGHQVSVGLGTGDREEGDIRCDLMVATYEHALSLVLSGRIDSKNTVVVADELQILGDATRGPSIEVLCTLLRNSEVKQFIALTATVENAGDLADWLNAELCMSHVRDVELFQEVRFGSRRIVTKFGDEEPLSDSSGESSTDLMQVLHSLLDQGRGPILVFAETRRDVRDLANGFAQTRPDNDAARGRSQVQLELFAEPTDLSEDLQFTTRRRVAIHTADLSLDERKFIETGIDEGRFDVCFATSTLAAGVNFPFQTVVFPRLTYRYGDRRDTQILRSDYRNMSGRAGRLGIHDKGYAVLLAKDYREAQHATRIVLPENDRIESQLDRLAVKRTVLALTASKRAIPRSELFDFLEGTYYASQLGVHNRRKLNEVMQDAEAALGWLLQQKLVHERSGKYRATTLGGAIARTGLLPETGLEFAWCLRNRLGQLGASLERNPAGLIHWACCSPEFEGPNRTRFLPWPSGRNAGSSTRFLRDLESSGVLLRVLDSTNSRVCANVHALAQYAEGVSEKVIAQSANISSGQVYRAANEVSWVLSGFHTICSVPSLQCSQQIGNQVASLARQVRWGAPPDAIELLQGTRRAKVPGFGRQSAMALVRNRATDRNAIKSAGKEQLAKWIGGPTRAEALLTALDKIFRARFHRLDSTHRKLGSQLGIDGLMSRLAKVSSDDYSTALALLLEKEHEWVVTVSATGSLTGTPWILLRFGDCCARIRATASPVGDPIGEEQLRAILSQRDESADGSVRLIVARPGFDQAAKKAVGRNESGVVLVEHIVLIEAVLRGLAGSASCGEVFNWLVQPGVSELERIPGEWSYSLV